MQKHGSFDDPRPTVEQRFWAKVSKDDRTGCWLWTANRCGKGYAMFSAGGTMRRCHRWAYEHFVGPIPEGLEIDHLCRVRHCVNPSHLEPVTHEENLRRAAVVITHCPQGHPYDEANTCVWPSGITRRCITCHKARGRVYYAANRSRVLAKNAANRAARKNARADAVVKGPPAGNSGEAADAAAQSSATDDKILGD